MEHEKENRELIIKAINQIEKISTALQLTGGAHKTIDELFKAAAILKTELETIGMPMQILKKHNKHIKRLYFLSSVSIVIFMLFIALLFAFA